MNTVIPGGLVSEVCGRRFYPPRSDLLFKKIFGDDRNTDLLAGLLQPVLKLPEADWDDVVLPDTHTLAGAHDDKTAVMDLRVATATGRHINVELQLAPTRDLAERMVFYLASMVVSQMARGKAYATLNQSVCVLITDFVMFADDEDYHHRFRFYDETHGVLLTDVVQVHVLELPKIPDVDDGTVEWRWLRFLAARTPEEMDMAAGDNPQIVRAATLVRHYNADEQFRYELEARERFLHDQASRVHTAHLDGFDEGVVSVARNGLAMGMTVEQISALTGLSPAEIAQLSQEA
ncbi:MAG: Rpn family recombination-promoting nuclease/putative transposase [Micrococcales bacterium]|nr:Rpn family recombination-promoting nuclease/putative transposase [Micrococcales bacterium]